MWLEKKKNEAVGVYPKFSKVYAYLDITIKTMFPPGFHCNNGFLATHEIGRNWAHDVAITN